PAAGGAPWRGRWRTSGTTSWTTCRRRCCSTWPSSRTPRRGRSGVRRWCSTDLPGAMKSLRERGFNPRMVFVDADDEVLIRRFESVRRSHPLQGAGRLSDGIAAERALLREAREQADVLIDTSHLNVNQLRGRIEEMFGEEDARQLRVTVLSFGFKYGLPPDADFVLDARFLPNPYWVPELREHTGKETDVSRYVLGQRGAVTFVETYARLINATAPGFEREGKRYLTIAVGCTGGKHRSVAIAEELARRLRDMRLAASPQHRDLGRERQGRTGTATGSAARSTRRTPRPTRPRRACSRARWAPRPARPSRRCRSPRP